MVDKVLEILDYFNPDYYIIENPETSQMVKYINNLIPNYVLYYCNYGYDYKKPTRFWTNIKIKNIKKCNHKKHKMTIEHNTFGYSVKAKLERYKIPSALIEDILSEL